MKISRLLLAALPLLTTACSHVAQNHNSYFKDTGNLKQDSKDKRALVWRNAAVVSPRSAFELTAIQWMAPNAKILPAERAVLTKRLETSLSKQFGSQGQLSAQGPVQIRGAITGVEKANVPVNILASAVLNFPVMMGGVAVDLEAVSKSSGERIAAGQYVIPGRPWQMFESLTKLGQARSGLDLVAGKFYTLVTGQKPVIDEAKRIKSPLRK